MPPVGGDLDDTSVTTAIAPWDPAEAASLDTAPGTDRTTQQTSAIALREYELGPGMKLGEYQLEHKLGQGGMGVVYEAFHPLIGKRAAIKILKKELCADPGSLERFVDEARVVNQIGHPNIVDVFAFGEMPDGRSYFVMELLKGETLRARIARSKLNLEEVRNIVKPLARALQAAHDKGVIHRDLKPDNVFLVDVRDEPPTAKLLDFGIAKLAKNDHRVEKTATGAIVGTPQYIAPEQAKGYPIDPRADIYALGAIIFELLTGRPPFIADNAMEMVAKHLMEAPVRPSTITHAIAPELDDLVLRMLAKTPDGRPSLGEVIAVIERSRTSGATLPFDRPTPPPAKSDPATPVPTAPISAPIATTDEASAPTQLPAFDAVPSGQTWVPSTRPKWVVPAIFAVPIVAALAFVLVSKLGSHAPATEVQAPGSSAAAPTEVHVPGSAIAPGSGAPSSGAADATHGTGAPASTGLAPANAPPAPGNASAPTNASSAPTNASPAPTNASSATATAPPAPGNASAPANANATDATPSDKTVIRKRPAPKKDPVKKDPVKKDPLKSDPDPKKGPAENFTIPDGDGLATPGDFQKKRL